MESLAHLVALGSGDTSCRRYCGAPGPTGNSDPDSTTRAVRGQLDHYRGFTYTMQTIYVTGGAGYKGAVLIPKLLAKGYRVRVLDLFVFGEDVLPRDHPALECIRGDIRDQ